MSVSSDGTVESFSGISFSITRQQTELWLGSNMSSALSLGQVTETLWLNYHLIQQKEKQRKSNPGIGVFSKPGYLNGN